jgi:predicted metal-binding protein
LPTPAPTTASTAAPTSWYTHTAVPRPTPAPTTASPTSAPSEPRCSDSVSWYFKKSKRTCDSYVSKKSKRCKRKDEFDVEARLACALTCGECEVEDVPAPAPTASECVDSTSWFYKKSKNSCDRFVSKKAKNCKKRDEFDVKARLACPMTCGECAE